MSFPYFEKIEFSHSYIANHAALIVSIANKDSWGDKKFNYVKKKIRFHYSVVQDDKCAYCRRHLNFGGYSEPIEHIVPRKDKFEWMFEPKNLVLSCTACNSAKSGKSTKKANALLLAAYSSDTSDYLIYHPHFEKYSDHIEQIDKIYYKWKTQKGKKTIEVCGLNNLGHMLYNASLQSISSNKYLTIINKITNPDVYGLTKKDVDGFKKEIAKRVKHLKKLKGI